MKKTLSIIALVFIINACDDGNLQIDNIDFEDVVAKKCDVKDVYYKIKDSEILFIELPATTFTNDETPADTPNTISITGDIKVTYRQYNDIVTSENVCPTVPSATPNVIEEWRATSGTIEITTTAIKTTDAVTNATKITGYKNYIVFKNITFQTPNGEIVYPNYVFGNYNTSATSLAFGFNEDNAVKSTCSNTVYNFNGSEVVTFTPADFTILFANEVTTTPRTALIDASNTMSYRLYNNVVTNTIILSSVNFDTVTGGVQKLSNTAIKVTGDGTFTLAR